MEIFIVMLIKYVDRETCGDYMHSFIVSQCQTFWLVLATEIAESSGSRNIYIYIYIYIL